MRSSQTNGHLFSVSSSYSNLCPQMHAKSDKFALVCVYLDHDAFSSW